MKSLRERLSEAGNTFDGHVTNGSLDAQMKVIAELCVFMTGENYPVDVYGNCAECGGGPEGGLPHDRTCVHYKWTEGQTT
jgi:hypothetical protein